MSNRSNIVAIMSITEIARLISQLQVLKRRAKDLEASDLAHLLGVAEVAANDWINKKLDELGGTQNC